MKSYSFTLKFKDEIGYFSQSQVISDVRDVLLHNGFVFGKNIKKVKKIDVKGDEVKASVSLLFDQTEKDLEESVNDLKSVLKKRKYQLVSLPSKNLANQKQKMSQSSKKKVSGETLKKKSKATSKKSKLSTIRNKKNKKKKKNKKESSWFNLF